MAIYKLKNKPGYEVIISFTTSDGMHKQIHRCNERTKTLKEAKIYESELLENLDFESVKKIKYSKLFEEFINYKKKLIRKTSINNYCYSYKYTKAIQNKNIYDIKKSDILKVWNCFNDSSLDAETKNDYFRMVKTVFNFAVKFYDLENNPCENFDRFKSLELSQKEEVKTLTYNEWQKLENRLKIIENEEKSKDNRIAPAIVCLKILYYSGMRLGEALGLTWDDFFQENEIYYLRINKSLDRFSKLNQTKNRTSNRIIPVCDKLVINLQEEKEMQKAHSSFKNSWFICGAFKCLNRSSVKKWFDRALKAEKMDHVKIHALRHSYCSLLVNGGVPIEIASQMLGHSTSRITKSVYTHAFSETKIQAVKYINSITRK